jgi:hypothetical protein
MAKDLDLTADVIDVRGIIARVEELREERDSFVDDEATADEDAGGDAGTRDEHSHNAWLNDSPEEAEELKTLEAILADLRGNGGDEQWEGDWYPVTLIRDTYFEDYARELADDIGVVQSDAKWPNNHIDWEAAATELQQDYQSTTIEDTTYLYR